MLSVLQVKKLTPRDMTCDAPDASGDAASGSDGRARGPGDPSVGLQLELLPRRDQLVFEGDPLGLECRLAGQQTHQEALLRSVQLVDILGNMCL
jgi:hypothetical protein